MSSRTDFDGMMVAWLEETAPIREPEALLDRVLAMTSVTRRRPAWWRPNGLADVGPLRGPAVRGTVGLAAVLALLVLALVLALAAGSQPQVPLPLGRAGLMVAARDGELLLVDTAGAIQRRIPTGKLMGNGAWSRDGSRLAYGDGSVEDPVLVVADASLNEITRIRLPAAALPRFSWSPDGRRITFGVATDTTAQIYVVDVAAGAVPVPITDVALDAFTPSWSPDGSLIAFRGGVEIDQQALYVVRPDGSGVRRLSQNGRAVQGWCIFPWSPDGRSIVFETAYNGVWIVDADGANERQLSDPSVQAFCPSMSPDGRRIVSRIATDTGLRGSIIDLNPIIGDVKVVRLAREIPGVLWDNTGPAIWSPDGHAIAINGRVLDGGPKPLLFVDPDGIEPTRTFFIDDAIVVDWQRLAP